MELEISIKEASNGLKTVRVTDRKKNAEIIKDYLSRNAVPALLTENTLKRRGYTWNNLFDDINEYVFKEIEKYETSKTYENITRPLCNSLLHLCIAGSIKGKAYIKCDKIMEICLYILKDNRMRKAIGDSYLNLLLKHVLPCQHYLGQITPSTYKDLLDVCIAACFISDYKIDNFTKLRLVLLVMRSGANNCQFIRPLMMSLSSLEQFFINISCDKKLQDIVIEIIILLLETLSSEYRLTMCSFMETVLPSLLKFYDQNKDQKKKTSLFKLLNLSVALHHPLGRRQNEEGSLANNWELWNKYLNSITEIICLEVNYLQKIRKQNDRIFQQCSHFHNLAASVHYQMFRLSERNDSDTENTSKRSRLHFNKNKTFSDLVNELQQNHIPWLGIIHVYVNTYSASISPEDYLSLLSCIQILLTNNNSNVDWTVFEEFVCEVLKSSCVLMHKNIECKSTLLSLWNSCVRHCAAANSTHKAVHTIIQNLLKYHTMEYAQAQHLIKLYIEKDMPVTSYSVRTLSDIFYKFYSKCSSNDFRVKCFTWLTASDTSTIYVNGVIDLLLRIITSENISFMSISNIDSEYDNLRDILFNSIEKCILFTEFEFKNSVKPLVQDIVYEHVEIVSELDNQLQEFLKTSLTESDSKVLQNDIYLLDCIKMINVSLCYLDKVIIYNLKTEEQVKNMELYTLLTSTLNRMYTSLNRLLNSKSQISAKIEALQLVKEILVTEFVPLLSTTLRSSVDADLFHGINNILNIEVKIDENAIFIDGDEDEMSIDTLKHNCLYLLAAYCRKNDEYRDEILKLVLDEDMYNFTSDTQCVFQCIELLIDSNVEDPPLGLIFTLMQRMCQNLYRDCKASYEILKFLLRIIDPLCSNDSAMKQNCIIMIKSYLHLCEDMFYPPKVASLIYECVAKIIIMNRKQNIITEEDFEDSFLKKIKGNVHNIRIYCCYLLKLISNYFYEDDINTFSNALLDIFLIDVPTTKESILKDESANRTFTALHCFVALAQTKKSSILSLILQVIYLQKNKQLDKHIIRKVLNEIINCAGIKDLKTYLNNNILSILHFWFSKNNSVDDLPLCLFEFENIDMFIERHMKWLIAGEILWQKDGNVSKSNILERIALKQKKPTENILEACFSNIMALCLPYIVSSKYNIDYYEPNKRDIFKKHMNNANRMFQLTGKILENERWSSLFVENVGELLLLTITYMSDREDAEQVFQVKLPHRNQEYYYPKRILSAILDYFEHLTDGNVLLYLCKNQTIMVFKILFQLWMAVTQENIFELKILALHAYVTFIKNIPLNNPSDAFMCNFACNSFIQVIKKCCDKNEMKAYIKGLKLVLDYLLPNTAVHMRKSLLEILSVLIIKKEAGYQECAAYLDDLINKMKDYLNESEDVIDLLSSMSQGVADNMYCSTLNIFKEKLKSHKISLNRPSHETLLNVRQFLSCNKDHIFQLYNHLESRSFSEDCGNSIIHQIIQSLCNILKSTNDDKTVIEACNCLSEISSYDLKTLVTVPPADTECVRTVNPTRYFMHVVCKFLLEVFLDEDPTVTDEIAETLNNILKFIDIDDIPDLEIIDKDILRPFSSQSTIPSDTVTDSMKFEEYCTMFPNGIFLSVLLSKDEVDWLKEVTCNLLQLIHSSTKYENNLQAVCALKSRVCRKILPALIGLLLKSLSGRHLMAISEQINRFFNYIWEQTFDDKLENSADSNISYKTAESITLGYKPIIQYMLDIVNFVRIQRNFYPMRECNQIEDVQHLLMNCVRNRSERESLLNELELNRIDVGLIQTVLSEPTSKSAKKLCQLITILQPGSAVKSLNYLELDYDKVAWAAAMVDQNWAALYYGELWAVFQNDGVSPSSPEFTSSLSGGEKLQRIFRKCYVSIGETDAIEGCGTAHLTIEDEKRKHLINTGQFTDALLLHDIALSCGNQADNDLHYGVVRSLHKSGMHHLALRYIKSLPENDQLNDVKYECLAFLGDWSDFIDTRELEAKYKQPNCNQNSVVKAFQYACLKSCLNIQTTPESGNKLLLPLNKAKLAVSRLCHNLNMENCQNIYKVLEKLHIFNDIEDYFSVRTNCSGLSELLQKWNIDNLPQFIDFKHIEALSSQRVLILEHAAKSNNNLLNEIVSLQIQYAKMALNNRRVQMAQRLLSLAKKSQLSEDITLVESEIAWAKGHKEIALSLLRNIVTNQTLDVKLAAVSLRRYALWMADSKRDNPREIIHKYLQKSLDGLRNEHMDVRLKVYHDIAKFADAEYKQVVTYMNSSIYENRVKCLENMKGTASSLGTKSTKSLTKEEGRALSTNRRFKELDEAEIANTLVEKENFLQLAMKYYLLSLKQCDENNLSVFRVISLWLDNQNFEFQGNDTETFEDLLNTIPSWKFVTVLPQLAPRLTDEDTLFINNLKKIIKRCAIDHPHHTLPILFGLKNSDKDNVIMNASGRIGGGTRGRELQPRVLAAQSLVMELRRHNEELANIVAQMEKMCDAIISFANYVPATRHKKQKIPDAENIHKLRNLNAIPVPTVTLLIRKDCNYMYIHTLKSFEAYYELVGGVNCPKKINCTDSSGKVNVLLIKGGDDLKQDAVMQQVFNIVNTLLEKDPVTNKNKLLIRTYKVVPMSRLSGVLEWCVGTIPMGMYLVGTENSGAHGRYRPQDISCDAARKKMIDCANDSHETKLSVYNRIQKEFKPVFHYFFTEHYLDPVTWYERRLAYTKSVATSSMVGYILGLGDRHVFNILIDKKTAEVIHIDLGIAFDQGKTLRTPETVPFRLTRDIIAGFGSSGTEGIFRRCCEKTMQLLRDNQETLLTILEVLLCDPLYSWSVKTAQQNAPTSSRNTSVACTTGSPSGLAKRALLVVTSKLSGTEDGVAGGVAVPGQVARLLHIATDPFNLCRLFHGWQPYL